MIYETGDVRITVADGKQMILNQYTPAYIRKVNDQLQMLFEEPSADVNYIATKLWITGLTKPHMTILGMPIIQHMALELSNGNLTIKSINHAPFPQVRMGNASRVAALEPPCSDGRMEATGGGEMIGGMWDASWEDAQLHQPAAKANDTYTFSNEERVKEWIDTRDLITMYEDLDGVQNETTPNYFLYPNGFPDA